MSATLLVDTPVEAHPHRPKVLAGETACVSVRPRTRSGHVEYAATLVIRNVRFEYQPSGQERVDAEGQRNVHAWARGDVVFSWENVRLLPSYRFEWVKITYNPFMAKYFFEVKVENDRLAVGREVVSADMVWMVGKDCFALNPVWGAR